MFGAAADQGHARAQFIFEDIYLLQQGVDRNIDRLLRLFQKAAAQDRRQSQYNLGLLHFRIRGVKKVC